MAGKEIDKDSELIFIIEETSKSPYIRLDAEKGQLVISGRIIPQNTITFFKPVQDFIEEKFKELDRISCEMKLGYFNSSGSKEILRIFRLLNDLYLKGIPVDCRWYYEEDDDDVLNEGEDLQDFVRFPIDLIEVLD